MSKKRTVYLTIEQRLEANKVMNQWLRSVIERIAEKLKDTK